MSQRTLAERIVAVDRALTDVPHAFGGALALAYYAEPRATIDIDVNLFVTPDHFADVAAPLRELGAAVDDPATAELVAHDGQVRVMWDHTPLDLFFAYDPFHLAAAEAHRTVPFAEGRIPILAAEHLVVCKVVFDRLKDWVDIEAVLELDSVGDPAEVLRWVARTVGDEDPRFTRIAQLLTR